MTLVSADTSKREDQHRTVLSAISDSSGIVSGGTSARIAGRPAYASAVPSAAASEREEQALGQQLPHEAARGPRRARRARVISRCRDAGPRQQQVRDVGARDQQQQRDGAEQDPDVAR